MLAKDEWCEFVEPLVTKGDKSITIDGEYVVIRHQDKYFKRERCHVGGGYHGALSQCDSKSSYNIVVNTALMNPATASRVTKRLEIWQKRNDDANKASATIEGLKGKLANYKDLAARFRLGYTGDPSDLDGIQNKCRAFLLGEGAKK